MKNIDAIVATVCSIASLAVALVFEATDGIGHIVPPSVQEFFWMAACTMAGIALFCIPARARG